MAFGVAPDLGSASMRSGEHTGVDNVLGLYGQLFELSDGTIKVDLKSVKAQGDNVSGRGGHLDATSQIYEGTNQVQRVVISKRLLG